MARADQPAAGVDRVAPIGRNPALLHGLPALARLGDAEVVNGHVFRGREAVVRLNAVNPVHIGNARAAHGALDGAAHMGQHIALPPALGDFVGEAQPRGVVPPALDARQLRELEPCAAGELFGVIARGQKHAGRAVGHLRAVRDANAPAHHRVVIAAALGVLRIHIPVAGLRVGIALRVFVIDAADLGQVRIVKSIALIVFIAEPAEELGEGKLDALRLVGEPRRRAQKLAPLRRRNRLHLLNAHHRLQAVAPGLNLRRRRQQRNAARGAGRLVAAGGKPAEARMHLGEESAQMPLLAVELCGEVSHMGALHLFRGNLAALQRAFHALAHQCREVLVLLGPVAREIRLVTAQHIDFRYRHGLLLC